MAIEIRDVAEADDSTQVHDVKLFQILVYILFFAIFLMEFLEKNGFATREMTWLPEILSIFTLLVLVLFAIPRTKVLNVSFIYIFLFVMLALSMISSILLNNTQLTNVVLGIRNYLKYVPFFLLPIVYTFSDKQILSQFKLLIFLALLQIPIAIYQRFVISAGLATGDAVRGTLVSSSHLSIFLICTISMLVAFRLRKHVTLKTVLVLGVLFLFPTTINETKGTLLLLPIALFAPVLFAPAATAKLKRVLGISILLGIFLVLFVQIYDHFNMPRYGKSILHFLEDDQFQSLIAPNTTGLNENRFGRGDVLLSPFNNIQDLYKLLLGLSIGNVSQSVFGEEFNGEYFDEYGQYTFLAFTQMIYELGIIGTFICLLIWAKIFFDARYLSKYEQGLPATIAVGWMGIVSVLFLSLTYKNIITAQALSFIFWFYSGYIASKSILAKRTI